MASGDGGNYTCAPQVQSLDIVDIVDNVDIIQCISTQNLVSDTVLVTIMEGDGTFAAVYEDTLASGAGQPTLGCGLLMLAGQNNAVTTRPHAYFTFAVYHLHQY